MSTTRRGSAALLATAGEAIAPTKESRASSSPVMTSGVTPMRLVTPSMNSAALAASRDAEVATKRTTPTSADRSAAE